MKYKKFITLLFLGIGIGMANTIAGISGATIALMSGYYTRIITALNTLTTRNKQKKHALYFLLPIISGVLIGLSIFAHIISFLLTHAYEQSMFFFDGLIIGSIPFLIRHTYQQQPQYPLWRFISWSMCGIILMYLIAYIPQKTPAHLITQPTFIQSCFIIIISMIAAIGMAIPGISGSFILLISGIYPTFINAISTFNISILLIISIGLMIGLVSIARIMHIILQHYPIQTASIITGIVITSTLQILPHISPGYTAFISIISLLIGFFLALVFGAYHNTRKITPTSLFSCIQFSRIEHIISMSMLLLSIGILFLVVPKTAQNPTVFYTDTTAQKKATPLIISNINAIHSNYNSSHTHYKFQENIHNTDALWLDVYLTTAQELVVYHTIQHIRINPNPTASFFLSSTMPTNNNSPMTAPYRINMLQTIPLSHILPLIQQKYVIINIVHDTPAIIIPLLDLMHTFHMLNRTIFTATNDELITTIRTKYPQAITAATQTERTHFSWLASLKIASAYAIPAHIIIIPHDALNTHIIEAAHVLKIGIIIQAPHNFTRLYKFLSKDMPISGIVTQYPKKLQKYLQNM